MEAKAQKQYHDAIDKRKLTIYSEYRAFLK